LQAGLHNNALSFLQHAAFLTAETTPGPIFHSTLKVPIWLVIALKNNGGCVKSLFTALRAK